MQKKIILFLIILFILSSAYLFYVAKNFNDPSYQKNWWAVYFEDPKSDNLNFIIENHNDNVNFHWDILDGNNKVEEKDILINKGEIKNIKLNSFKSSAGKVTIQVTLGDQKKEIYKNF